MRSGAPLRLAGSETGKSSSRRSKKPFGLGQANPDLMPSSGRERGRFAVFFQEGGMQSMTTAKEVMKMIKDNDVKYVDFRFTDPRGKWQHVTFDVTMIEEDTFAEGQMFDGSSIAGWKAIHESDMNLMPDPASACIDPFFAETTLVLVCDVLEPPRGEPYSRDPRGMAKKAEALVRSMGLGDTIYFGPEAEFFVFDDVRYSSEPYNTGFRLDQVDFPPNAH